MGGKDKKLVRVPCIHKTGGLKAHMFFPGEQKSLHQTAGFSPPGRGKGASRVKDPSLEGKNRREREDIERRFGIKNAPAECTETDL